jgi:hypothetical protein
MSDDFLDNIGLGCRSEATFVLMFKKRTPIAIGIAYKYMKKAAFNRKKLNSFKM